MAHLGRIGLLFLSPVSLRSKGPGVRVPPGALEKQPFSRERAVFVCQSTAIRSDAGRFFAALHPAQHHFHRRPWHEHIAQRRPTAEPYPILPCCPMRPHIPGHVRPRGSLAPNSGGATHHLGCCLLSTASLLPTEQEATCLSMASAIVCQLFRIPGWNVSVPLCQGAGMPGW
jgi:hypothetical protein